MISHRPGVYIFKDRKGHILYVGKALDLKSRISSYFSSQPDSPKTAALVENIAGTETIEVSSEIEALILEANLIKKYLPPFNIKLIDDKDYLYVKITGELFPKITTSRKKELVGAKKFFGPFPSSRVVRDTLKKLRRLFPWCSGGNRACFYYHLGLCPGPCVNKITRGDYAKIINRFVKFMEGKKDELIQDLTQEMETFSKNLEYEKAGQIKRTLEGLWYLTQSTKVQNYLDNPNFLEQERKISLEVLEKELDLPKIPERIEGFDISNISGKEAVGSMVVLTRGEIDKSQYRKFKINISGKPNDVGMMKEILQRRMNHTEWAMPDLIIVDGGRAQARCVGLPVPVFGLAKRLDWLYPPDGLVIKLPKRSPALKLLQKLRDEAHRFALAYHRKLRDRIR